MVSEIIKLLIVFRASNSTLGKPEKKNETLITYNRTLRNKYTMRKPKITMTINDFYTVVIEEKKEGKREFISSSVFQEEEPKLIIEQNFYRGETQLEISKKMMRHIQLREISIQNAFNGLNRINLDANLN